MSRSTSQSSTATSTTGHGLSRNMSVKTTTTTTTATKTQSLVALPVSDVKLFVTNLRLLDLDLRDDWPGITVQTFSAKNADQKQRISSTEWALFRLFEMWDAAETAQKLQPFFPPLEPLQSLNLRAALYRCLNELKKNGILGRESVLRKTMLDECKGDKFYEILAIFSNAVLKKALSQSGDDRRYEAVARKLATASTLSSDQQKSLLPLAIAHRAALQNVLRRKEESRKRYSEFQKLLDTKAEEIKSRIRRSKDTPRATTQTVSQKEANAIKKQLQDNWIGDQKWLDVMLHGDDVQTQDAFLQSRFEKVWRMVEAGRSLDQATPEAGLLQNLQNRVQEQQDRLQQWREFHERIKQEKATPLVKASKPTKTAKDFKFDTHLQYQLPSSKRKPDEGERVESLSIGQDFAHILSEMDKELLRVSKSRPMQQSAALSRRRTSSSSMSRSPIRSRKNTRSEIAPKVPTSPVRTSRPAPHTRNASFEKVSSRHAPAMATPTDSDVTLIGQPSTVRNTARLNHADDQDSIGQQHNPARDDTPLTSHSPEEVSSSPPIHQHSQAPRSPSPTYSPTFPSEPPMPTFDPPTLTAEEALAEQIVDSIANATPSPVKKPQPRMSLSLMERTRLSMARTTSFPPIDESPLPQPSPELPEPPTIEPSNRRATLLERTLLSMQATQSKPRQSLAPRDKEKRKSRTSLFPVNQFDTPRNRKSFELIEEAKSSDPQRTPRESLFSDEIDYERVFKSRPRVATSPMFSPAVDDDGFDEGVTGIDLADVDADEDDDPGTAWADSPSRRRGGGY